MLELIQKVEKKMKLSKQWQNVQIDLAKKIMHRNKWIILSLHAQRTWFIENSVWKLGEIFNAH